jgi:acetoacetyl-CoA synthetase
MEESLMSDMLWQPSRERIERANMTAFMRAVEREYQVNLPEYGHLYQWSIDAPADFWLSLWRFTKVVAEQRGTAVLEDGDRMPGARWFPAARLNFAQNLLRRRDAAQAIVFWGEDRVRRSLSYAQLYEQVSRLAQALRDAGVSPGDRIGAFLPNMPETVIAMLGAASIGAVFSSCSPDFGVRGVVDRFGQIAPKVLIGADGYYYMGKTYDCLEKLEGIAAELPSLERMLVVPYVSEAPDLKKLRQAQLFPDFLSPYRLDPIRFESLPFDHPLYILYSSGTTGVPKCIVHGAGGTLLQHLKEHVLHTDVRRDERIFYYTTCGWMMWNWLASALASEATLLLYDGSPFYPSGNILFDYADTEGMTIFGTSAKYIDSVSKAGLQPRRTHSLATVKTMLSTGSPLAPASFDFVYREVKSDILLASISGGTDIMGCFALGNPLLPVYRGELQCRALGMKVEVWNDQGVPVRGQKGELVCAAPFPSMPVGFWNDPEGARYRAAYFERFPSVWCHGDYVEHTAHDGLIIYGRSDAVLNPGGVRIGTAEIYRQVEQVPEVIEALAIGQDWDNDVRVILFVRLQDRLVLDEPLIQRIRMQIRVNATPRHVPAKIIQVADIPRTRNGKIVELAVRNVVHGRPVQNLEALANPEALQHFAKLPELRQA